MAMEMKQVAIAQAEEFVTIALELALAFQDFSELDVNIKQLYIKLCYYFFKSMCFFSIFQILFCGS